MVIVHNDGDFLLLFLSDSFCCWLKSAVPKREPNEDAVSGVVHRERYRHPPTGMRSAVPLGGLGTGSFELRADGKNQQHMLFRIGQLKINRS